MLETEPFICTFQISTNAPLRICKIFMRNGKFVILTTLTVLVLNYRTIFQDRNCFLQTWDSSIRRYDHHPFVSAWTPRAFNDRARVIGEPAEVFWRHFANICAVRTACYFVRDPPPPRGSLVKPQHTRLQRNNFQRKVIRLFRGLAHARLLLALLSRSSTPLITNSRRLALSLGSFLRFCLFCSSFVLLSFSLSLSVEDHARGSTTHVRFGNARARRGISSASRCFIPRTVCGILGLEQNAVTRTDFCEEVTTLSISGHVGFSFLFFIFFERVNFREPDVVCVPPILSIIEKLVLNYWLKFNLYF